jgi:site-specific recombinase XerD
LLFHVCTKDATPAERRDVALLALLTGYDLRRAEVVVLDLFDHTAENGALLIRQGKGRKDWPVYLPARAQQHLRWRMSAQTVFAVLRARGAVADLAHFSPHDLLRTYISNLLDTGADLAIVQQLAGHADPAVTARYDRRREAAKQRTSQLLQILLASELGGGSA